MKREKRLHFCRFDLVILIVVMILGAAAWVLIHGNADGSYTITAEQLLEDLRRNSDENTDQTELEEIEYYNVNYTVLVTGIIIDQSALPQTGEELFDTYSGCSVGMLQDCTCTEHEDGSVDAELTIRDYAIFTKLKITTPAGTLLRVGEPITLSRADGSYVGSGTIIWMSH